MLAIAIALHVQFLQSLWRPSQLHPCSYPGVFRPPRSTTPGVLFQAQEIPSVTFHHWTFFDLAGIHCEFRIDTFLSLVFLLDMPNHHFCKSQINRGCEFYEVCLLASNVEFTRTF
jgi:hypothetical protein